MIKLYHGTSRCLAEKIIKEGFQSHTWFASNEKRARVFGKLKDGIPVVDFVKTMSSFFLLISSPTNSGNQS